MIAGFKRRSCDGVLVLEPPHQLMVHPERHRSREDVLSTADPMESRDLTPSRLASEAWVNLDAMPWVTGRVIDFLSVRVRHLFQGVGEGREHGRRELG